MNQRRRRIPVAFLLRPTVWIVLLHALAGSAAADTPAMPSPVLAASTERGIELRVADRVVLASPPEGLWSVATGWTNGWPTNWIHAPVSKVWSEGDWTCVSGHLDLPAGRLELTDAYRADGDVIRGLRRFTWTGKVELPHCTLSVRWMAPGALDARPLLPGILYYGNPSGARTGAGAVAVHTGVPGEVSMFEEHRYAAPFACVEWRAEGGFRSAALHTLPSRVADGHHADQWWSLGVTAREAATELTLLTGPCAANGHSSVVKALQQKFLPYPDAWMTLRPGAVVEKTFFLQACPQVEEGSGFRTPLRTAMRLNPPYSLDGLPTLHQILRDKWRFAASRFRDRDKDPGFEMFPDSIEGTHYVMGWCGQAEALGGALIRLAPKLGDADAVQPGIRSLNLLATSPFNERGFHQRYTAETGAWSEQDPVSQGQAMENFARAIVAARARGGIDTGPWEAFLKKACTLHADRILRDDWRPVSTAEAFYVSPLCQASQLFGEAKYRRAALKAAEHYARRHVEMREPYWGGTLDARCEDKEGALAGFQAFLAVYELDRDPRHLQWAAHALDVALTYTVLWDIDLPAGRLRDHALKTRGWTIVSAQNQHLDVYAVLFTPEIWRMGDYLGRPDLKRLAAVMFRSCGQMIDPRGSQGEQIQQTNFGQSGQLTDVFRLRGGYSEHWTVFWMTAHFLNAAAQFEALGVDLDRVETSLAATGPSVAPETTPAPLYRDPVYDGAADPVLVWNPFRQAWWMLYTQRRAKADVPGVEWCHQTEIGLAESRDEGLTWAYRGTVGLKPLGPEYSFWAPDVIRDDHGRYHLFVSYVPGAANTHRNWGGERYILHYSSTDLEHWSFERRIPLASDHCIDPTLIRRPDGAWRMWYKDEGHDSKTYAVESRDLKTWTPVADPGISKLYGEGPKTFRFGGRYWLIKDPNSGLDVYRSEDLESWTYQGKILDQPGTRNSDGTIGKHADVVVCGDRAFIIYFTHPYTEDAPERKGVSPLSNRHTALQAAELEVVDGKLVCDRNKPFRIRLTPPETKTLERVELRLDRRVLRPMQVNGDQAKIGLEAVYSDGSREALPLGGTTLQARTREASGNAKVVDLQGDRVLPREGGIATLEATVPRDGREFRAAADIVVTPWFRDYHQTLVMKLFLGMEGNPVERLAKEPMFQKPHDVLCTFEEALSLIRKTDQLTRGIPKILYLVGWQKGGHDHGYPSWDEVNPRLKRAQDATALDSLRWLIREARAFHTTVSLHLNMVDAYEQSPAWAEYVAHDCLARDAEGKLLSPGIQMQGEPMYNVVYPREWEAGLAQRRIDRLIAMIPELRDGHTIHVDVFIAQRENAAPISPWHAKPENGGLTPDKYVETQRKIFHYWRDRGFDVTGEGIFWAHPPGEGFTGLQSMSWWYPADPGYQMRIPECLMARGRTHRDGDGDFRFGSSLHGEEIWQKDKDTLPGFLGMFCRTTLPWYYLSRLERQRFENDTLYYSDGVVARTESGHRIIRRGDFILRDDDDLFVPALWKSREIVAYSRTGYNAARAWRLPEGWSDVKAIDAYTLTPGDPIPRWQDLPVLAGQVKLSLSPDEAVALVPAGTAP